MAGQRVRTLYCHILRASVTELTNKPRYHVTMPDSPNRVSLDRVDWPAVLPVLRLASAFRHAMQPGKLIVALLAVLLINGAGLLLGEAFSESERSDEETFGDVLESVLRESHESNPYEWFIHQQGRAFSKLTYSALSFDHGFGSNEGVADALYAMVVGIPFVVFDQHPWFAVCFGLFVLFIAALSSGLICRMAATQVCRKQGTSLPSAGRFVARRWAWYLLTPMMPTLLILVVGGVLIALGFVLFNLPGLDVVGSALYGLLLVLGFVIALVSLLFVFALFLMAPSMSVEGTDGFDAVARSFNYVMFKPWQYAGYLLGSMVYLAAVFALVAALAELTFAATYSFVDVGVFAEVDAGQQVNRHDAIVAGVDRAERSDSGMVIVSAWIVEHLWFGLLSAIVAAVMFSTLCCLQTQAYVLMRRCADGTPLDDCADDEDKDPWSSPADMVDPEAQAIAAAGPSDTPRPTGDTPDQPDTPSES